MDERGGGHVGGGNCTQAELIKFAAVGSVALLKEGDVRVCPCFTKHLYMWKRFSEHGCVSR